MYQGKHCVDYGWDYHATWSHQQSANWVFPQVKLARRTPALWGEHISLTKAINLTPARHLVHGPGVLLVIHRSVGVIGEIVVVIEVFVAVNIVLGRVVRGITRHAAGIRALRLVDALGKNASRTT